MSLKPRKPVPPLELDTLSGKRFKLGAQKPGNFDMIVFYRGLHCPVCRRYLTELDGMTEQFAKRGVNMVIASSDSRERAEQTARDWGLKNIDLAYGLSIDKAREWDLFVSTSRGKTSAGIEEPPLFNEPGLFLVKPDGSLYWSNISTMPFARPHFNEILGAIDFAIDKNYPARGEA